MASRFRAALVEGQPAIYWKHRDGHLVHRGRRFETQFWIEHLTDQVEFEAYIWSLQNKDWVKEAAIDELRRIAAGVRR